MTKDFTWIPFYMELADKLKWFRHERENLIDKLKHAYSIIGLSLPRLEFKGDPVDIDPFSVFALFNKGISIENRIKICSAFSEEFELKSDVPVDFSGIPVVNNLSATFYAFINDRKEDDIDNLWEMFICAIDYSQDLSGHSKERFQEIFDKVKKQKCVKWNLTMGLFWMRPYVYINLDSCNREFLLKNQEISDELQNRINRIKNNLPKSEEYLSLCNEIKKQIVKIADECIDFPSFSNYVWNITSKSWGPVDYEPGITVETWKELIADKSIFTVSSLEIMKRMLDYGGQATCTQLSNKYGEVKNYYVNGSISLAKRVAQKIGCPIYNLGDSNTKIWPVLYVGKAAGKEDEGSYIWKIRDELAEALNETDLTDVKLYADNADEPSETNYWFLVANPRMWSMSSMPVGDIQDYTLYNENHHKRRIFQNFLDAKVGDIVIGYESTPVKQIVALMRVAKENDGEKIYFEKTEGLSVPIEYSAIKDIPELSEMEYFQNMQGSLFKLTKDEYECIFEIIREDNPAPNDHESCELYSKQKFLEEVYMSEENYDELRTVLMRKKNIILQGAPGVGKTFAAKRLAYSIMEEKDDSRIEFIQFHQNYSYEDFMMGYKPDGDSFKLSYGVFYKFCKTAENNPSKEYFFIIDEINRGNMSKIFGELLMLIEKEYRGTTAVLAYNGQSFNVPKNLYIIGMMNTADRSLAMIDYALRRRFSFIEIEPGFNSSGFTSYLKMLNNEKLNRLVLLVNELNDFISNDRSLGKGFCIGHSYFCGMTACSDSDVKSIVKYDILPMLREYWFDDDKTLKQWEDRFRGFMNEQ